MAQEINERNFKPLRALVLVEREVPPAEKNGIIIPSLYQQYGWRARVIRPGPEASAYKTDDVIFFLKDSTVLPFKDKRLALTDGKHILAKLTAEGDAEIIVPQNNFVLIESHPERIMKGGIYFPDQAKKPVQSGWVIRFGPDCQEVKRMRTAWFEKDKGVNCVERGIPHKLIAEEDIMAIQSGI